MKKTTTKSLTSFYVLLFAFLIFTTGCGGGTSNSSFLLPSVSTPVPGDDPLDGTSDGVAEATQFYVGVKRDASTTAHVRRSTDFNSKCAISTTDPQTDIDCIIDIPEGDLYTNGLIMKYNIPPSMCRYVRRTPYWYYNKEVGIGPAEIIYNVTTDTGGNVTAISCSVDGTPGCTGHSEVELNQANRNAICIYDRSASGQSNCCFGNYTITTNTAVNAGPPTANIVKGKWGGDMKNCIGGAGKTNWPAYTTAGFPATLIEQSKFGLVGEYKINAPISTFSALSTTPVANYFHPTAHTHTGFVSVRSTNKPFFVDPVDDRSGTEIPNAQISVGSDAYVYECLDEAWQVKHRIRVYVREWDTYPDYLNYLASSGVVTAPDLGIGGIEPTNCPGVEGPCNDQYDNDDFLELLGGTYDMSAPAIPLRSDYFPNF